MNYKIWSVKVEKKEFTPTLQCSEDAKKLVSEMKQTENVHILDKEKVRTLL